MVKAAADVNPEITGCDMKLIKKPEKDLYKFYEKNRNLYMKITKT